MFEISQLRCFVAVAEELHFGRAAERLNMTQPPLSRQINLLEHHVGTRLIERTSRSVELTAAGKSFLPEAMKILRLSEEASATARRVAKGEQGSLAIGFTAVLGYGVLPELLRLLRQKIPGVTLTLKELVTSEQLELLDSGELDIGFMRPHLAHGELATTNLPDESLMLAIPEQDEDKWSKKISLDMLHQRPFLMYSPYEAKYFYQLLQTSFDLHGVKPDIVEYIGQIHSMLSLVSSGIGVALVPQAAAKLQFKGVVLKPMSSNDLPLVESVCSYRKNNQNPMLARFLKEVLAKVR
jgi:DNA-binding transcriptional LysR family regulator